MEDKFWGVLGPRGPGTLLRAGSRVTAVSN